MCDELFGKEADLVDWRHFLVCVAQPWPLPLPHQLLETLGGFREASGGEQRVGRQVFMAVELWMDKEEGERGFNRNEKLKQFLFELFSEEKKVDYTEMVSTKTSTVCVCVDVMIDVVGSCCICVWTAVRNWALLELCVLSLEKKSASIRYTHTLAFIL